MEIFWEILKISIPAVIVFLTAYFLLKMMLDKSLAEQAQQGAQKTREKSLKFGLPLKLQAYERFTLLCERCDIGSLILRLRSGDMSAETLKMSMLVSINQEFEHNLSQQMYVSETLWEILKMAKEETFGLIQTVSTNQSAEAFIDQVFETIQKIGGTTPMQKALGAIRAEVRTIL